MGLLGMGWEDPQSSAIMQLAGGLLSGNFGQGAAAYGATMAGAKDAAMKRQYMQSQIDENTSQADVRKQQLTLAQRTQAMEQAYFGAGGTPGASASLPATPGSASPTAMPGAGGGLPAAASPAAGKFDEWSQQYGIPKDALIVDYLKNGGKGIAEMLSKRGTPDMQVTNGYAYDKNKVGAGFMPSLTTSTNGQTSMTRIGQDGMPVVSAPRGALETAGAYAGMQAGLSAAAKINLRKNADGTETPVSELTENPKLQSVIGGLMGAPAMPGYATEPQMKATVGGGMGADRAAIEREIKTTQRELMNPLDAGSKDMLRGYLTDLQRQLNDPRSAAQPGSAAVAPAYGMTTTQEAAAAAQKTQATADVKPLDARNSALSQTSYMINSIDRLISHPGLEKGTGLQGAVDPRNYIPGTEGKNFRVALDQIKGGAFLQAFESLKGGGAVSEMEGTRATDAIARLNTAQSPAEFKAALTEFREVMTGVQARQKAGMPGGAPADAAPKPAAVAPLPANPTAQTLTKGQAYKLPNGVEAVWDGMKFKGK